MPYENFNTEIILDTFNITKKGCYYFTIYDSYGDGLQSGNIEGGYIISNETGETLFSGGDFKIFEAQKFKFYKLPPIPTFTPSNNQINISTTETVKIIFPEIIRNADNSLIVNPDSLFVFKLGDEMGEAIPVDFKIWKKFVSRLTKTILKIFLNNNFNEKYFDLYIFLLRDK